MPGAAEVAPSETGHGSDKKAKHNEQCEYHGPDWFADFYCFFALHDKFWVAFGTLILAVSTGVLGFATVFLWRATKKLVLSAEETAQRQLRAYVTCKQTDLNVRRRPSTMGAYGEVQGTVHSFELAPVLLNAGATPATNIVVNSSTGHFPNGLPSDFDFPDSQNFGYGILGPESEMLAPALLIEADRLDPTKSGGEWYMWGWVEYDDAFDRTPRRRTEFCLEIERRKLPDGQTWVGMRPIDRFNAMDSNCRRPPKEDS